MLWPLSASEVALDSELTPCEAALALSELLTVGMEALVTFVIGAGRGVVSVPCVVLTGAVDRLGESGRSSFFSLIVITILSRCNDVMCFSFPLLLDSVDSRLENSGRLMSTAPETDSVWFSSCSSSSEAAESTLADSSGISSGSRLDFWILRVGTVWSCSQQKVSRFHNLQLRFSNRRPSSSDSAHFENTAREISIYET